MSLLRIMTESKVAIAEKQCQELGMLDVQSLLENHVSGLSWWCGEGVGVKTNGHP